MEVAQPTVRHVTQSEPNNCVSACLSMVLNIPQEVVTEEFHQAYIDQKAEAHEYLNESGIPYRHCMASERHMKANHVYMVSVPSANIECGLHQIVVELDNDSLVWVFDPNNGRKGRYHYAFFHEDASIPKGMKAIKSWMPDFEFKVEDVRKRYEDL